MESGSHTWMVEWVDNTNWKIVGNFTCIGLSLQSSLFLAFGLQSLSSSLDPRKDPPASSGQLSPWALPFMTCRGLFPPLLAPKPNWLVPTLLFPSDHHLCAPRASALSKSLFKPIFARNSVEASVDGFAFPQASSVLDRYLHFLLTG